MELTTDDDATKKGQGMVAAWGKGADYVEFPPEAGYKLGKSAARFIVLEFHLDNPGGIENRTVRSGVRLYTTSQLRPNDVGVIVLVSCNTLMIGQCEWTNAR